jgi:acetoacetyl-CoA synthetase
MVSGRQGVGIVFGMEPIWTPAPARVEGSLLAQFMSVAGVESYADLHARSIADPAWFWRQFWDSCGVVGQAGDRVLIEGERMREAVFFPDARLNVVDTLLARNDDSLALMFRGEAGHALDMIWSELHARVSQYQQALREAAVGVGSRVAAMMANTPDIYALMLATASVGAVFTSVSPDFGAAAAVDRFSQVEPDLLFASDRYY